MPNPFLDDTIRAINLSLEYSANSLLLPNSKTRPSFLNFQKLISILHPARSCRLGATEILSKKDTFFPESEGTQNDFDFLKNLELKNSVSALINHSQCIDSNPDDFKICKGYTCGLWHTFHSMSITLHKLQSSQHFNLNDLQTLEVIRDWIESFFLCDECRQHFLAFADEELGKSLRLRGNEFDLSLFLWRVHNDVNTRTKVEEEENMLDVLWPRKLECNSCWDGDKFVEDEVKLYLEKVYGSLYEGSWSTISGMDLIVSTGLESSSIDLGIVGVGAMVLGLFLGIARRKRSTKLS
eukprot:snap_masked-scaffold_4-processed-gene-1.1-mRNA-1 protein AED:1.00 eAED:1.00 QI:0/-1/0/0/-1/1/1/0/295